MDHADDGNYHEKNAHSRTLGPYKGHTNGTQTNPTCIRPICDKHHTMMMMMMMVMVVLMMVMVVVVVVMVMVMVVVVVSEARRG